MLFSCYCFVLESFTLRYTFLFDVFQEVVSSPTIKSWLSACLNNLPSEALLHSAKDEKC